jgi:FKBP-type peptidyl-prolyl cis-trans isomerase FklB
MSSIKTYVFAATCLFSAHALAEDASALKTQKEKLSYTIGFQIANDMKQKGLELDPNAFSRAVKDVMTGSPTLMSEHDMIATLQQFRQEMVQKQQALAEKNKKEGDAFLKANAKKKGVKTLPSGLEYKVIQEGKGKTPKASDVVVANYRGTTIDGKEFDSSYKRGQPATFPVGGVIKGWQEALMLMKEGAKWEIVVPANLAYGEQSPGPEIGPNSTLIFDIELVKVQEQAPAPGGKAPAPSK